MIASTICNNIIRILYSDYIKNNTKINIDLFKEQIKMDTIENQIKLGMFYVSLYTGEAMDIFKKEYSPDAATYLSINTDYSDEIIDNMIIHPNTLPMICKPLE
jgi:hydrogenase maturation factor